MKLQKILIDIRSNGVVVITLNRPDKYNAIDGEMYRELSTLLRELGDNQNINMVILTGAGKYYSSGNDMSSVFKDFTVSDNDNDNGIDDIVNQCFDQVKEFVDVLIDFPKLLVALVNGPAIGIAVTSLALFDIVYAVDSATFRTPFSKIGLCAESCSSYLFPKIFGRSKSTELLNFNTTMIAREALEYKFISKIIEIEKFEEIIADFEEKCVTLSVFSFNTNKYLISQMDKRTLHIVNALETENLKKCYQSGDFAINILKMFSSKI